VVAREGCRTLLGRPREGSVWLRRRARPRLPPARLAGTSGNGLRAGAEEFRAALSPPPATRRTVPPDRKNRLHDRNRSRIRPPPVFADPGQVGAPSGHVGTPSRQDVPGLPATVEAFPHNVPDLKTLRPGGPRLPPDPPGNLPEGAAAASGWREVVAGSPTVRHDRPGTPPNRRTLAADPPPLHSSVLLHRALRRGRCRAGVGSGGAEQGAERGGDAGRAGGTPFERAWTTLPPAGSECRGA